VFVVRSAIFIVHNKTTLTELMYLGFDIEVYKNMTIY